MLYLNKKGRDKMLPSRLFFDNMLDDFRTENKMRCDIYEKDDIYHIEADIPGFDKSDINIEFDKGTLSVIAEKSEEEQDESKNYIRRERTFYGKYQRSFYLGDVDEEKISASFDKGILKISVPKKIEQTTKKSIEIQ